MNSSKENQSYLKSVYKSCSLAFYLAKKSLNQSTIMLYVKSLIISWISYFLSLIYGKIVDNVVDNMEKSLITVLIAWYITGLFGN